MTRREAILTALAATVCGTTSGASEPEGPQFLRWDAERGDYLPIEGKNIRAGDSIWIKNEVDDGTPKSPHNVYLADTDAIVRADGVTIFGVRYGMGRNGEWLPLTDFA